jgi:SAM-dependent methyltransferase
MLAKMNMKDENTGSPKAPGSDETASAPTSEEAYVHGYSARETQRLVDQATTLSDLLHGDTAYPPGSQVLEAGCGVGAQTVLLARNSPQARITAMDISPESLAAARRRIEHAGLTNVTFAQGDIFHPPFAAGQFDHLFLCFVLEHLRDPLAALRSLKPLVKPGGTLTVIEGDHGSAYFHPDSPEARRAIECLIEIQGRLGGDALIGRRLYPLLVEAGLARVRVSPRLVYVDGSRPALIEGFTKLTFTAMVEGVREQALRQGLLDARTWTKGVADLHRTARPDGVFCYCFFKAVANV